MTKIACCLNCSTPIGPFIYCQRLAEVLCERFDETGETQGCIYYTHQMTMFIECKCGEDMEVSKNTDINTTVCRKCKRIGSFLILPS